MKSSLATKFDHHVEEIFPYIAYSKDIKEWTTDKDLIDVEQIYKDGKFIGSEAACIIDSRRAKISSKVLYLKENEEIRMISKEAEFDDGEKLLDLPTFPYDEIEFQITFESSTNGCKVINDIYIKPRGLIGWFACKLFVLPYIGKNLKKDYVSLNDYLRTKI